MKKANFAVGDYVLVPHGGGRDVPGLIIRRYKARYDTIGWHWRYSIRYLKEDLTFPKRRSYGDLREGSFIRMDVLEVLAKLPAAQDQAAASGGSRRRSTASRRGDLPRA